MKRILLIILVLGVTAGVASADRGHHRGHWKRGGGWSGGVRVTAPRVVVTPRYVTPRYVTPRIQVVRRPIYVQRPAIRYRYYNYYQRPSVIVENYPSRVGYYWVAGAWNWGGYEWIWTPGHYEPDPAYYDQNYDPQYDANQYDQYDNSQQY